MRRHVRDTSSSTRESILAAALTAFHEVGFHRATVARICAGAGVSNGSFFHFFPSKEALAAELYVDSLQAYHDRMLAALADLAVAAEGVAALIATHLDWVVRNPARARFLFEQAQADWLESARARQEKTNAAFRQALDQWRLRLVAMGAMEPLALEMLIAQIIGPAQLLCRRWLAGKGAEDLRGAAGALAQCAVRALNLR